MYVAAASFIVQGAQQQMKTSGLSRYSRIGFVIAATLAGCGVLRPAQDDMPSRIGAPGAMPQTPAVASRVDWGKSWMLPEARGRTTLLYVSLDHRVAVYDYDTGKRVGSLTGLDDPYGGCVDAKGDVYVTEYFNGDTVEYAHGGTKVLKTFASDGQAWGCSVDGRSDLAVTDRDTRTGAGQVCVWKSGKSGSQSTCYGGRPACDMMSPAGYDDKGNLFVPGEDNATGDVCVLLAGATSMTELPLSYSFNTPGAAMWDGKYMTLSDEGANGEEEGIVRVTISGSTLHEVGRTLLSDTCYAEWEIELAPFILGLKNTPVNREESKVVVANNSRCADQGAKLWKYTAGGYPYKAIASAKGLVAAISIGR
jgi:hypothetical protein